MDQDMMVDYIDDPQQLLPPGLMDGGRQTIFVKPTKDLQKARGGGGPQMNGMVVVEDEEEEDDDIDDDEELRRVFRRAASSANRAASPEPMRRAASPEPIRGAASPEPIRGAVMAASPPEPSRITSQGRSRAASPGPSWAASPGPNRADSPASRAASPARSRPASARASRAASPGPSRAASPGPSRAASPGPSRAASPGPSRPPSPELEAEARWEREKLEEMGLLFPEYSPDWMKEIIQGTVPSTGTPRTSIEFARDRYRYVPVSDIVIPSGRSLYFVEYGSCCQFFYLPAAHL
jgi:hypothetical protein